MNLTSAQQTTFKAAIAANTTIVTAAIDPSGVYVGQQINQIPSTSSPTTNGANAVANFYNQIAAGPFYIFDTDVPIQEIGNGLLLLNYTIVTSIPPDATQLYTNCAQACIAKSVNLQNLLLLIQGGGGLLDASLPNIREGLKDSTSNIPSGTPLPTNQDGGWTTNLKLVPGPLVRSATTFESMFAIASTGPLTGTGNLGTATNVSVPSADALGGYLQGSLDAHDVFGTWGFNL